jgi:hypothetical protein
LTTVWDYYIIPYITERKTMTQLTDEHFELHSKNKAEQFERQKIKFLEDRIKVLENAIESHAKILARFQMTEGDKS